MEYRIDEVTDLLCTVWQKDNGTEMKKRPAHGFVICDNSAFSFFTDKNEVIADSKHILILPQNSTYNFICRKSGVTYTYNFYGKLPEDVPYNIEIRDNSKILSYAGELRKVSDMYAKTGLMYRILGETLNAESSNSIPEIIKPQIDYINSNIDRTDLSNGFLASMTNISEVYFRKLFKRTFGISPHEYIINQRIEKAKQLLMSGNNVSETALLCGFSNLYYFSGAFKKFCGISPSEYVKQYGDKI